MLRNLVRSRSLLSRFSALASNGGACRVPLYECSSAHAVDRFELPTSLSLSNPSVRLFHSSRYCLESVIIKCPPFAESITEGDVRWEKAVGDSVEIDEPVAEVETDKTGIPITSPTAGVIEALLVEDGDTVTPGMALLKISTDAAAAVVAPAAEEPKQEEPAAAPPAAAAPSTPASIPESLPPVPPVPSKPISEVKVKEIKLPTFTAPVPDAPPSDRSESRVKMNRMRQRVGQRLKDSQNVYAMLTTFNEIDMTNIMEFRNKHKDAFLKKHGIKLSFMSAFIKASAYALQVFYFT